MYFLTIKSNIWKVNLMFLIKKQLVDLKVKKQGLSLVFRDALWTILLVLIYEILLSVTAQKG